MKKSKVMIAVFLLPAILCFLLVYAYPTVRTVIMSFYNVKNIADYASEWKYVGAKNYILLSHSEMFRVSLLNIGYMWLWGGIIVMAFALLFAVILTSTNMKFKSFFRSVIYLPNVVAAVAMGMVWMHYVYNSQYGLFKSVFEKLGLKSLAAFQWTSVEHLRLSMTIAFCFGIVGYFMLIYIAAMEKIPADFYEAAILEGANSIQKFFKITLPLMRNVFRTTLVLWSTAILGFFTWTMVFSPTTQSPALETITPIVYMNYIVFSQDFTQAGNTALKNAGTGAAVGVIVTIITVIVFTAVTKLIKEDNLEY